MFGLSWPEIFIILAVGVFVLGPERIPVAVRWVGESIRKLRGMAATAQSDLRREIGPELDELRRQVADLQSMQEFQDIRSLRGLNPKRYLQKNILGDEFSGGMTGFLGLNGSGTAAEQANAAAIGEAVATNGAATEAVASANGAATESVAATAPAGVGAAAGSMLTNGGSIPAAEMSFPMRRVTAPLGPGELAPFDADGT